LVNFILAAPYLVTLSQLPAGIKPHLKNRATIAEAIVIFFMNY